MYGLYKVGLGLLQLGPLRAPVRLSFPYEGHAISLSLPQAGPQ